MEYASNNIEAAGMKKQLAQPFKIRAAAICILLFQSFKIRTADIFHAKI